MSTEPENGGQWESLADSIAGLGERSIRKSYYPELKATIRGLDRQRTFYQSILNSIPDGVVVFDATGRIKQGNPALCRMFGFLHEELLGKVVGDLYAEQAKLIPVEEFPASCCRSYRRQDGSTFLGETTSSEIRDENGQLLGNLEVIRDLTDRVEAVRQQKKMEEQFLQSQKMAAIGTLAGGIAHDFNNLLAAILGFAELALMKIGRGVAVQRDLEQILKAGGKATELVNQILAFSRKETTRRQPLRLGPLVKEALKLLRGSIPTTIAIKEHIVDCDRLIMANPTQVHQVIMNLCTNAFHAMEDRGGRLSLSLVPSQRSDRLTGEEREYLRISIADTGAGIAPAVLERIFEPYFTTKPSGKGTGMGLAVVHGIVENHEGHIEVDSAIDQGTVFHVYFPVVAGVEIVENPENTPALLGGTESILVVDDERMVADYLRSFLEQLGYTVTVCNTAIQALEVFANNPEEFALVITDQTMPGKTGFDMALDMLAIRPELPIILCSGYSAAISRERVTQAGIREFATKPLSLHVLAPLIRSVLGDDARA